MTLKLKVEIAFEKDDAVFEEVELAGDKFEITGERSR